MSPHGCVSVPPRVSVRAGAGARAHVCAGSAPGCAGFGCGMCRFSCPPGRAAVPRRPPGRMREGLGSLPPAAGPSAPRCSPGLRGARGRCGSGSGSGSGAGAGSVLALPAAPPAPSRRCSRFSAPAVLPGCLPGSGKAEQRGASPETAPVRAGVPPEGGRRRGSGAPGKSEAAAGNAGNVSSGAWSGRCRFRSSDCSVPAGPQRRAVTRSGPAAPTGDPSRPVPSRPAGAWGSSAGRRGHAGWVSHAGVARCCCRGMVRGNFFIFNLPTRAGNKDEHRLKRKRKKKKRKRGSIEKKKITHDVNLTRILLPGFVIHSFKYRKVAAWAFSSFDGKMFFFSFLMLCKHPGSSGQLRQKQGSGD